MKKNARTRRAENVSSHRATPVVETFVTVIDTDLVVRCVVFVFVRFVWGRRRHLLRHCRNVEYYALSVAEYFIYCVDCDTQTRHTFMRCEMKTDHIITHRTLFAPDCVFF